MMMTNSGPVAVALALLLLSTSAACGDDDDTMSTLAYRTEGNEICENVGQDVREAVPDEQPTVQAIQEDVAPALASALSSLRDRLGELRPPPDLAAGHAELLSAIESAVETAEEAARDDSVAARLREEGPPLDEIGTRATELGLTSCAG